MKFYREILQIDPEKGIDRICEFIRQQVVHMRRDGVVIGLSGGIDSAVCAELCIHALGKENVLGLILPEKESNPISKEFALKQAKISGIETEIVEIDPVLEGFGTYKRRDSVIKQIFPEYDSNHSLKITLPPDLLSRDTFNFFTLTIDDGKGHTKSSRLKKEFLNGIVAATNTKQRARMMFLVCGTTNRTETVQGFFVKFGDGGVDIEPIAHLYKNQVYQIADYLGVIEEIQQRIPSPDTFSTAVSDEEFFFRIPFDKLDLLLYAWENEVQVEDVCKAMDLAEDQVKRAFRDFKAKYDATEHLRNLPPSLLES
jgi:NAD+ synthase